MRNQHILSAYIYGVCRSGIPVDLEVALRTPKTELLVPFSIDFYEGKEVIWLSLHRENSKQKIITPTDAWGPKLNYFSLDVCTLHEHSNEDAMHKSLGFLDPHPLSTLLPSAANITITIFRSLL